MEAKARSHRGELALAVFVAAVLWAAGAISPAYAFDYGRGVYGSGAYNVGQLDPTTTTLISGTNPSTVGDSVTFTAAISPGTATGTVTVRDGVTALGTITLGHASGSLTTSVLAAGSHSFTAVYGGNVTLSGSTSNTVTQVVNAAASASSSSSGGGSAVSGGGGGGGGSGGGRRPYSGTAASSSVPGLPGAPGGTADALPSQGGKLLVSIDGNPVVFRDVSVDSWYAAYVYELVSTGIVSGYRNLQGALTGLFKPQNAVTGAEALKMALTAAGKPLSAGPPQNRSARSDWSAPYVKTAEDLHLSVYLVSLDVRKPATRGEVIQTVMEAFGVALDDAPNTFSDLPASSPYAKAIVTAARLGIIGGDTDRNGKPLGTIRPKDPINRAEAAKIIARAMDVRGR